MQITEGSLSTLAKPMTCKTEMRSSESPQSSAGISNLTVSTEAEKVQ